MTCRSSLPECRTADEGTQTAGHAQPVMAVSSCCYLVRSTCLHTPEQCTCSHARRCLDFSRRMPVALLAVGSTGRRSLRLGYDLIYAGVCVVPGAHAHDSPAVRRSRAGGHPPLQRLCAAARAAPSQVQRSGCERGCISCLIQWLETRMPSSCCLLPSDVTSYKVCSYFRAGGRVAMPATLMERLSCMAPVTA